MSTSIQNPVSSAQYQLALLQALAATGISQFSAGGKARAFADIVADQLGNMETREYVNLGQTLLSYASGKNLDDIGEMFGVRRLASTVAQAQTADQNFLWYVRTGTFGDINKGQDITIPADVRITNSDGTVTFLSDPATLHASDKQQSFSATSATPGSAGNISKGQLTFHNFSNYSGSGFGSLLVTNNYGVIGGRDGESDNNYRTRISLWLKSPSGVNETALRFQILQVPGVQDVVFEPQAGQVTCYIYSVSPQPAASLLINVQQVIDSTIAYPSRGIAVAPDLVGVSLATSLTLQKNLSATDQANIVASAASAAQNYLDNLGIGNPLVINEIATSIFNSDARILDVGRPNNEIPEILIWRSRPDGSRYSRFLLDNYTPSFGERVVTEMNSQIATPISLTVA